MWSDDNYASDINNALSVHIITTVPSIMTAMWSYKIKHSCFIQSSAYLMALDYLYIFYFE